MRLAPLFPPHDLLTRHHFASCCFQLSAFAQRSYEHLADAVTGAASDLHPLQFPVSRLRRVPYLPAEAGGGFHFAVPLASLHSGFASLAISGHSATSLTAT